MEIETIKDAKGKLLGMIEHQSNGDEIAKNYLGRILARYSKSSNTTRDVYGRIVAYGNVVSSYIFKVK